MKKPAFVVTFAAALLLAASAAAAQPKKKPAKAAAPESPKAYLGSHSCRKCHADYYESFLKNAKKAQSFAAVEKMNKRLTPKELDGCYSCHTTGYGKPGGFESLEKTPDLAHTGCAVCHGPGSRHARSTSKADIQRLPELAACEACHVASRIKAFNYRPVLRAGAH
ncbi:MAG TPA: cytochrome c family protein [Myxococcales bacterium]|jgi:hypothetical protein